jgi:predicted nucleic acid-binding protein
MVSGAPNWRNGGNAGKHSLMNLSATCQLHPVTVEVAGLAGLIEGDQAEHGLSIAFEDLLIAATALHLRFGVATGNVRHFKQIPGLSVIEA